MRRFKHNLSSYKLTTFDLGQLVPVGLVEALPGDTFDHDTSALVRLSPLAAPVMHPVTVRLHHFFVPHRLVWSDAGGTGTFEDFITGGNDGNDAQTVPTMSSTGTAKDLLDYYGIPLVASVDISAVPAAGFNAIFNEYYRDQDLVTARDPDDLTIPQIAWEKDYFTASRPWPQRGDEVTLPLGTQAPVTTDAATNTDVSVYSSANTTWRKLADGGDNLIELGGTAGVEADQLYADLSSATAASVVEIRRAFALQRYKELRARYGARYVEYLRYLGVRSSDARLDRPEYLGGGRVQVSFSEVLQTAPDTTSRDFGVGDLYGHGIAAMRSNRYRYTCEEHGYIHTLMSVRPKSMYLDGIHRTWLRTDKESFWQRELEFIGQQEVYKNEVYADSVDGTDTWSYQDRYSEYRGVPSNVAGEFRSTLDYWHLGRKFTTDPALNSTFVECVPGKRVFNEQTQNSLWVMARHRMAARRLVSNRANPRIL